MLAVLAMALVYIYGHLYQLCRNITSLFDFVALVILFVTVRSEPSLGLRL
jgi:hypothetical protein